MHWEIDDGWYCVSAVAGSIIVATAFAVYILMHLGDITSAYYVIEAVLVIISFVCFIFL